jgi:hypothetical protein
MDLNLYNAISGAYFVENFSMKKSNTWVEPEHAAFFPNANQTILFGFRKKTDLINCIIILSTEN